MTGRTWRFNVGLALLVLCLVLGACGKRGPLKPPPGEEARYTFPRPYPNPSGVLPGAAAPQAPLEAPEDTSIDDEYSETEVYGPK